MIDYTTSMLQAIGSRSAIKALQMEKEAMLEQYRHLIREKKLTLERLVTLDGQYTWLSLRSSWPFIRFSIEHWNEYGTN